ncbi:MAG: phosphoglycerate kinase [Planctomycetota bacterium]|jgi:phosphoglycerate kinase
MPSPTTTQTKKRKKMIEQVDVTGKRVLMRVDFNVPLDEQRTITDDRRIRLALPSIRSVIDRGGRLILMSHLGRPKGAGPEPKFSLEPAATRLAELLGEVSVRFIPGDCAGAEAAAGVQQLADGQIVVLDNLRFSAGEKKGDPDFAAKLAAFGDVFCHEAFGTSHRNDASVVAVPQAMTGKPRVAGFLLQKELHYLSAALADPKRPFFAVLGGAKVSDKLGALHNLMGKVDTILVGGAMAYTYIKALGHEVGKSLVELDMVKTAKEIIDEAAISTTDMILPHDHICGREMAHVTPIKVFKTSIDEGWMGLDLGPETVAQYIELLHQAGTIVWNGPVGVFETPPFDVGSRLIAVSMAGATGLGAVTIVGGGDTAAAAEAFGLSDRFSHISTGGGASLQMLEGRPMESVNLLDEA